MNCETVIPKLLARDSMLLRHGSLLPFSSLEINGRPIPLCAAKSSCPQPRRSRIVRSLAPKRIQMSSCDFMLSGWSLSLKERVADGIRRITVVMLPPSQPFSYEQTGCQPQVVEPKWNLDPRGSMLQPSADDPKILWLAVSSFGKYNYVK